MKRYLVTLAFLYLSFQPVSAEPRRLNPNLTLSPDPTDSEIRIDGILEPEWEAGERFENFAEFVPSHQIAARVNTEGHITYDESNLYIAFVCWDPSVGAIRTSLTDRDRIYQDDFVGVIIDTYRDQQRAYEFFSNPHGIQGDMLWQSNRSGSGSEDAIWQANGGEDESYDAVWESEGKIYDDRWVVEMKIPFSSMRYPNSETQNWLVHFVRNYPRDNRYQFSWMPISQDNNSFMGQAGSMVLNLGGGVPGKGSLEVLPYAIGSRTGSLTADGTGRGTWNYENAEGRFGFNTRYVFTSNNVLDFTYRPDFSQIESDAGRINVNNPFAFFYQERRPFFVEGSEIFQVDRGVGGLALDSPANLIYTRSVEDPLLAAKITGKSGKFSYGFITANDDHTPFILPFADGTAVVTTDERSWSNILRAKYDVGEESFIGLAATNRQLDPGGSNTAASIDGSVRISENYTLMALTALTYTSEPIDSSLSERIGWQVGDHTFEVGDEVITAAFDGQDFYGHIFKTRLLRQARHWNFKLGYQDYSPGVRADNSSIFSNDGKIIDGWTGYSFRYDEHPALSIIQPQVAMWRKYDYEGDVKDTGIKPQLFIQFQKQTAMNVGGFLFNREKFRGVRFDDARQFWVYLGTDVIEKVTGSFYVQYGKGINRLGVEGDPDNPFELIPNLFFNGGVTVRPTDQITNYLQYNSTSLWTNDKAPIVKQQIFRNTFSYQFSKQLFIRLIGEMILTDRYDGSTTSFSIEPLLSYKLNPFTVFFLGANIGGRDDPYVNYRGLTRTNQTLFAKFQYLWSVY